VTLSALLGAGVAVEADPKAAVVGTAAVAVLLVLLAVVTGRSAPIPVALLLLGALYVLPDGERAVWVPLYGGGLLLCAELAYWSLEERRAQPVFGDVVTPRLVSILLVAAASVAAGALVQLAGEADVGRSAATTAAASLAVAGCAALLVVLVRGRASGRSP
jgi:hypothetical protein